MTGISPSAKILQIQSTTKHGFSTQPTPLEFNLAIPNAYQMVALCLCNNMTLTGLDGHPPPFEGDTKVFMTGISTGSKILQIQSSKKQGLLI